MKSLMIWIFGGFVFLLVSLFFGGSVSSEDRENFSKEFAVNQTMSDRQQKTIVINRLICLAENARLAEEGLRRAEKDMDDRSFGSDEFSNLSRWLGWTKDVFVEKLRLAAYVGRWDDLKKILLLFGSDAEIWVDWGEVIKELKLALPPAERETRRPLLGGGRFYLQKSFMIRFNL